MKMGRIDNLGNDCGGVGGYGVVVARVAMDVGGSERFTELTVISAFGRHNEIFISDGRITSAKLSDLI